MRQCQQRALSEQISSLLSSPLLFWFTLTALIVSFLIIAGSCFLRKSSKTTASNGRTEAGCCKVNVDVNGTGIKHLAKRT